MKVQQDFFSYSSGIYRKSNYGDNTLSGYHSVRLIGWGEEKNCDHVTKYWIAANSFGTRWGEQGKSIKFQKTLKN